MNPYALDQCIDDPIRDKLEAKIEEAIDKLLHEPEFLRTLQPRMQSLSFLPASEPSQQIAKEQPVTKASPPQTLPPTSPINNRFPDLDLYNQIPKPTQIVSHSNTTSKRQPDSTRPLSPFMPISQQVPKSSNNLPLHSQSQKSTQDNSKSVPLSATTSKELNQLPDLVPDSNFNSDPVPNRRSQFTQQNYSDPIPPRLKAIKSTTLSRSCLRIHSSPP